MTNQEINERIAKVLGWKRREHCKGYYRDDYEGYLLELPNYAGSLDACREFEGTIGRLALEYYAENLAVAVWGSAVGNTLSYLGASQLITATALQRCEAFLRMKGQWDEN